MQKNTILVLSVLVLFMFIANASAKIIDVVHLKNGSIIQGTVTVINESIKIETDDGSTFIVEMSEVDKIKKVEFIKPKNPLVATGLGCGTMYLNLSLLSPIPIFGVGQVYNGQYLKALAFLGVGAFGVWIYDVGERIAKPQDDYHYFMDVGMTAIFSGAILSTFDAYYSAKRINSEAKKKVLSTTTSLNLNYIPHEGLMASYHFRF